MENKDKLKAKIITFIATVIDKADEDGNLDYFEIEIKHHRGDLQQNITTKNREKVF